MASTSSSNSAAHSSGLFLGATFRYLVRSLDFPCISEVISFLCSFKNSCKHSGIRNIGISCHFCQVSIPAPARIGVYFKQPGSAFGIKPPVKAGIVPAPQPAEKSKAGLHNFGSCLFRKLCRYGFDFPVWRILNPFGLIAADSWEFLWNSRVIFFDNRQYGTCRRVSNNTNTDILYQGGIPQAGKVYLHLLFPAFLP